MGGFSRQARNVMRRLPIAFVSPTLMAKVDVRAVTLSSHCSLAAGCSIIWLGTGAA